MGTEGDTCQEMTGEPRATNGNAESLYCPPETDITLNVNELEFKIVTNNMNNSFFFFTLGKGK